MGHIFLTPGLDNFIKSIYASEKNMVKKVTASSCRSIGCHPETVGVGCLIGALWPLSLQILSTVMEA